jgi:hypothetical protein
MDSEHCDSDLDRKVLEAPFSVVHSLAARRVSALPMGEIFPTC